MLELLKDKPGFAIDVETTSVSGKKKDTVHFLKNEVVCIGIAYKDGDELKSFCLDEWDNDLLTELLSTKMVIGHNVKFDLKSLHCPTANIYFDTLIAAKLLNENRDNGLKSLGKSLLKEEWGEWISYRDWLKDRYVEDKLKDIKLKEIDKIDYEKYKAQLMEYCAKDAEMTLKLARLFDKQLEKQRLMPVFKVEMEVLNVFLRGEIKGVPIDIPHLEMLAHKYSRHVARIEKVIYEKVRIAKCANAAAVERQSMYNSVGNEPVTWSETGEFNINSSKQLSVVLYEIFGLPILKTSAKSGEPSCDVRTLTELSRLNHRIVDWILYYRHWSMLVRHITKLIEEAIDERVYTTFNTIGTETGRFSCKEPNLQQIPSKTMESMRIREAFTGKLIVADYSNVELRLLAHFTKDEKLIEVYSEGGTGDLHQQTADLLKISRKVAKTINFGISYGMGPGLLAQSLNIDKELAKDYIEQWYKTYKRVQPWKDMIVETVRRYGFVRSIYGRKRRVLEINHSDIGKRFAAEREAINFVIQGASADITKLAVAKLKDEDIRLQIHDEIVIYNPKRSVEEINSIMESVGRDLGISVPLIVEGVVCDKWSDGK